MSHNNYVLWIENTPVAVSEQVYNEYNKMKRREKYLEEADIHHGKIYYQSFDTDDFSGENMLVNKGESVEDIVIRRIITKKLNDCLNLLNKQELVIVCKLFYCGKTERELARELNIPQTTLNYRKNAIIKKLQSMMEQ